MVSKFKNGEFEIEDEKCSRRKYTEKEWVENAFRYGQTDCCEYCFGNIFMWSDIYDNRILNDNGIFVSADFTDKPVFCYPIGNGDKKATIEKLIEYTKVNNMELEFFGLLQLCINLTSDIQDIHMIEL